MVGWWVELIVWWLPMLRYIRYLERQELTHAWLRTTHANFKTIHKVASISQGVISLGDAICDLSSSHYVAERNTHINKVKTHEKFTCATWVWTKHKKCQEAMQGGTRRTCLWDAVCARCNQHAIARSNANMTSSGSRKLTSLIPTKLKSWSAIATCNSRPTHTFTNIHACM